MSDNDRVEMVVQLPDRVSAPVKAGSIAGKVCYFLDEVEIGSTYLVYTNSADENLFASKPLKQRFLEWIRERKTICAPMNLTKEEAI